MATSKSYIGSGKPTKFNGVIVTLRMEDAKKFVRTGNDGQEWLSFIVSPKQATDDKGRTHNAFVLEGRPDEAPTESVVNEPAGTPIGETTEVNGKKLKRISKAQAAKLKGENA